MFEFPNNGRNVESYEKFFAANFSNYAIVVVANGAELKQRCGVKYHVLISHYLLCNIFLGGEL